ncbi:MAG: 1-phosphofructokinase family hexose kinase [Eubacteriales bacterium]|nr:1-phosphofructokinase family hexose kinase [Eubacteriales bacterium]
MFYTVTLNPALDYAVWVDTIKERQIANDEAITPGGKGVNVSLVLKEFGLGSTALGFIAGFSGAEVESRLNSEGIITNFTRVEKGLTRINIKIKTTKEIEINGKGPEISENELADFLSKLDIISGGDTVILSGSVPISLPGNIYDIILNRISDRKPNRKPRLVIDITGEALLNALRYKPFMIKPNLDELKEVFGGRIESIPQIVEYAKRLQEDGAENVLVTLGADGAVLLCKDGSIYEAQVPNGKLVNSTGAGDSTVAGFLAGYDSEGKSDGQSNDLLSGQPGDRYETALRMSMAAGCAKAFSKELARKEQVLALLDEIIINQL